MNLVRHSKTQLQAIAEQSSFPVKRWVLALSGGLDSVTLLHLLIQARLPEPILVIHVNHGLQAEADEWAAFCSKLAKQNNLPVIIESISISAAESKRLGIEASARNARYKALQKHMLAGDVLLTAQHQNDQAETVLLQLMRGAGVAGLSAMPMVKMLTADTAQARPLLDVSRQQLQKYAQQQKLQWVEDSSNQNTDFDRNFLRSEVIPILQKRWPSAAASIANSAAHCAEVLPLQQDCQREKYRQAQAKKQIYSASPNWQQPAFFALSVLKQPLGELLFRDWLKCCQIQMPTKGALQDWLLQLDSDNDRQPLLQMVDYQLRRYQDIIWLVPSLHSPAFVEGTELKPNESICLQGGLGTLKNTSGTDLILKHRKGGERVRLNSQEHSSTVKGVLQEAKVFPWLRDVLPLIYCNGELLMHLAKGSNALPEPLVWSNRPRCYGV